MIQNSSNRTPSFNEKALIAFDIIARNTISKTTEADNILYKHIPYSFWKKRLNNDTAEVLRFLKELKLIFIYKNGSYVVNSGKGLAKGYACNPDYLPTKEDFYDKANMVFRKIQDRYNLAREIKFYKNNNKIIASNFISEEGYQQIMANFKKIRISNKIDKELFKLEKTNPALIPEIITNVFYASEEGLVSTVDEQGRIYTYHNQCKKHLRKYFYSVDEGELPTIELDISSSHAFHLGNLLPETSDTNFFNELVENGILWDYITQMINCTKKRAKDLFIKHFLYSKSINNTPSRLKFNNLMKEEFPTIMNYVIKEKKKIGNKAFARKLMSLEAEIMIQIIYPKLGVWALPIHDAYQIYQKDKEHVLEVMQSAFKAKYNRVPTIKQMY